MRGAILLFAITMAEPALAAGGEHVIDDAAVETPGTCHLESWVTLSSNSGGLLNGSPACTREEWPNLELGGFVSHSWTKGTDDMQVGLSPKLKLRSEHRGIGIGIAASIGYGIDKGRFETASIIVPVTIPVGERLRLNVNGGWQWSRTSQRHDIFGGVQTEIAVADTLSLMIETFSRDKGKAGGQSGLRWTVADGAIDIDLIGGRYVDGATRTSLTLGLTLRR